MSQSLDQERAAYAWGKAVAAQRHLGPKFDSFKNLAKGAPALIMGNGLMPTLAYLENKGGEAQLLGLGVCEWLSQRLPSAFLGHSYHEVMEGLHSASSADYIRATEEALQILRWVRQLAPTLGGK
jgi:CRISPR-associated protein Cmr5